jgi:hypothetical protein
MNPDGAAEVLEAGTWYHSDGSGPGSMPWCLSAVGTANGGGSAAMLSSMIRLRFDLLTSVVSMDEAARYCGAQLNPSLIRFIGFSLILLQSCSKDGTQLVENI